MNVVSNRAAYLALTGDLDVETDIIKVALHTNLYSENKDNNTWSVTNEVSGAGYTSGGATLTGSVVTQNDTADRAEWDANDVEWPSSTITARYAVVYNSTQANAIICVFDFGTDQSSSNGLFAVRWNATGILTLAQA